MSGQQLDPRINAYRPDLADARLRSKVVAGRFVEGQPGRIVAGRAPVHGSPDDDAETLTFYHYGDEVMVFEVTSGCAWCQSQTDGYVGYVAAESVLTEAPPKPTHYVATLGAYCYRIRDLRGAPADFLPRHAAVAVSETGLITRGAEYARLDTGLFVPIGCLSAEPPRSPTLVAAAALYLGAPYLWGGKGFFGIDCSGLVQSAFRDLGIVVPRDTDMQAGAIGEAVSLSDAAELRRGDLLYPPGHVLIYAGDDEVIHADGASMMVRRECLSEWLLAHRLELASLTVRRHPAAAG